MSRFAIGKRAESVCVIIIAQGNGNGASVILQALQAERGFRVQVLLFDNHTGADYRDALRKMRLRGWLHYRQPALIPEAEFRRWVYQTVMERHSADWFLQIGESALPQDQFLAGAIASWKTIADDRLQILSLVGPAVHSPSQVRGGSIPAVRVETFGKSFLASQEGVRSLAGVQDDETPSAAVLRAGGAIYQLQRSLVNVTTPILPQASTPSPQHPPRHQEAPKPPAHIAAFFVPTCHRPNLLRSCLHSLRTQKIPDGWGVEILVAGIGGDAGREEALWAGAKWVGCSSDTVTAKLNACISQTGAELILLADDDDVQPPDRLKAAVDAYRNGADWAGSGLLYFYHVKEDRVVRWQGEASLGLVGTSLSFAAHLLRQAGGWPERRKGKDGPMARRINALRPTPTFADLSGKMDPIVCHQHGGNLWNRPVLEKGLTGVRGKFSLAGLGALSDVRLPEETRQAIRAGSQKPGPRIRVAITSYNRPDEVLLTLRDIETERAGQDVQVVLYDDGSTVSYKHVEEYLRQRGWDYVRVTRYGKHGYLQLMLRVFEEARKSRALYHYFLQDDIRLCQNFFSKTIALWDGIGDARKATLFLLVDGDRGANGVAPWTTERVAKMGAVNRTQWVDGNAFMFGAGLFQGLAAGCPPPPQNWFTDPSHGSGFGRQVSRTLNSRGYSLYQTPQSYVAHTHSVSVMNSGVRAVNPLLTVGYVDGEDALRSKLSGVTMVAQERTHVTVGIASIPSRRDTLRQVVQRLLLQVDEIGVYLNGYPDVPDFLRDPRIKVVRSQDKGDIGDAGKFHWVGTCRGYYATCDDDLLYPPDYIQRLVKTIEDHGRRAVVGVHGALLREPLTSYYQSRRVFHFSKALGNPVQVHVLGTGTTAFHTSTIQVTPEDFKAPNMADVWLAVLGQVQRVPFFCIPRGEGWLQDAGSTESIFGHSKQKTGSSKDTADLQTEIVKKQRPWALPRGTGAPATTHKAVFLVPTTNRPILLRSCLESLKWQVPVPGWTYEVRVIGTPGDRGRPVVESMGLTYIESPVLYPGLKLNAGAASGDADLWLAADDDDIQSPMRLTEATKAFEQGHGWASTSGIHFFDLQTGRLAFWKGPAALVGTTTSMSAQVFRQVGGWPGVSKGKEGLLQQRLQALGVSCYDLGSSLKDTVCLQHGSNLWHRPSPQIGEQLLHGQFLITGLPEDSDLPEETRAELENLGRRLRGES